MWLCEVRATYVGRTLQQTSRVSAWMTALTGTMPATRKRNRYQYTSVSRIHLYQYGGSMCIYTPCFLPWIHALSPYMHILCVCLKFRSLNAAFNLKLFRMYQVPLAPKLPTVATNAKVQAKVRWLAEHHVRMRVCTYVRTWLNCPCVVQQCVYIHS